jgi:hypothetical protein
MAKLVFVSLFVKNEQWRLFTNMASDVSPTYACQVNNFLNLLITSTLSIATPTIALDDSLFYCVLLRVQKVFSYKTFNVLTILHFY